jgi:demethylmenaquinone methyltransferase/2-methoxy-6-polyprenyl-1,4-benzoquinol methylase
MFSAIAPRYVLMNSLMTFGQDRFWRRSVVRRCQLAAGKSLLDVATGTGDIAAEALRSEPGCTVVGIDLTREMMTRGRAAHAGLGVPLVEGDALALPLPSESFDAVCSGFLMRNVVDVPAAFAEQVRVLRPGGRLVCLEITMPTSRVVRTGFRAYFFRVVPLLGWLVSGQREAYTYLPESVLSFPDPRNLARMMESAGLRDVRYQLAMFGTVALHWGTK